MAKKDEPGQTSVEQLAERMTADLEAIGRGLKKPLVAEAARGGLTPAQTTVMSAVVRAGGITLKDLSKTVGLAHSTVSVMVDRLAKRGMVEKRPDAEDGRFIRIWPTAAVSEFVRAEIPALKRKPLEVALAGFSSNERSQLEVLLMRLRALLERE